jgi:O-antigen ligase
LTLAIALMGVSLVFATYAGREATLLGVVIAGALLAVVVVRPEVGVLILMTNYLVASYPTPIRGEGLLTINNLLGIILAVILIAQLAQRPDFWFLRARALQIFFLIGAVFALSTMAASYQFPDLRVTSGRFRLLDQTYPMARAFVTRVAFIILAVAFLSGKRHLKLVMTIMMMCLIMVVPSALFGYVSGRGVGGYRAAAEFSAGTNPNRLAFLCLIQMGFWWYFMRANPSPARIIASLGIIASLIFTVFLTASRSGAIGLGIVMYMLSRSRGGVKTSRVQVAAMVLIALGLVVTIIPTENIERLQNLNPFATGTSDVGSHSTERRVETVEVAWEMALDYPIFGVGLGNFREVARQVYQDPFWRPPHNSYMWAVSEGGVACLLLYVILFYVVWRDIRALQSSPAVPPDLRWITAALEPSLILTMFYSFFADIWLSPITYILVMIVLVFKRYVSTRRVVVV